MTKGKAKADKRYEYYGYYPKLTKAEQHEQYYLIEPMLDACKTEGYKAIHSSVANRPEFRQAREARSKLYLSLNGLITRLALNRGITTEELPDVFSYCTIFLDKALMRFDISRNFAFTSFAFVYLKGAILNFIRQNNLIIQSASSYKEGGYTYSFIGLDTVESSPDNATIDYILSTLSDSDARLITWYYRLNTESAGKDNLVSLLQDGICVTSEAVNRIISEIQGVMCND